MKIPFPPSLPLSPSSRLAPLLDSLPLARPLARWLARWLLDLKGNFDLYSAPKRPKERGNGRGSGRARAASRVSWPLMRYLPPSVDRALFVGNSCSRSPRLPSAIPAGQPGSLR